MKFNLVEKNTDLSFLERRKPKWDILIGDVEYDVYDLIDHENDIKYVHTYGGRWGENSYWCCPRNEKPTYENLIQFGSDSFVNWGVIFEPKHYIKSKWDETETRTSYSCWITRNGEKFYNIMGREMSYCLAKAQYFLVKLQETIPFYLNERNWKEQAIGMRIGYKGKLGKIKGFTSENHIIMQRDDGMDNYILDMIESDIDWFPN